LWWAFFVTAGCAVSYHVTA